MQQVKAFTEPPGPIRPHQPPKTSGHDTVLRAIQSQERRITVALALPGMEEIVGYLVSRDKYTITVKVASGARLVIFKSAIAYFWGDEKPAAEQKGV